jgi:hypothetical protein
LSVESYFAVSWPIYPGNEIENSRLAGAVRTDQPDQFVFADLQVQRRDRRQPTESDGAFAELEQWLYGVFRHGAIESAIPK